MEKIAEVMSVENIQNKVYMIRGQQVMLDFDLAEIYGYEVKNLNQQVKRNIVRFPEDFMFQLTREETDFVKSQIVISRENNFFEGQGGGRRTLPYAFTEQGIYMLATVLKGELISEDVWKQAQVKVAVQAKKYEKVNSVKGEKIHLLSGMLKCPVCGAGMYGNKSIKSRKDGTRYKDYFYYGCKHRNMTRGHKCDYRKQINEEMLDGVVAEVIRTLVSNKKFAEMMKQKINIEVDTSALDQEIANYEKQRRQCFANREIIMSDLDNLDYEDKHYRRRKSDLEERLYKTYDKIEEMEVSLVAAKAKKRSILSDKISGDNIYKALVFFDKMHDRMNEAEKREFIEQLIEKVEVYEERQPNGQWLKSIEFKLPIIEHDMKLSLDNGDSVETVVLLSQQKPDDVIEVEIELDELDLTSAESKATYAEIKDYVLNEHGLKVSNLYISQVKRKCGIEVGENYNLPKSEDSRQPQCPEEKEKAIRDALDHFGMIRI